MNKDDYIKIVNEKLNGEAKKIMLEQIENYYEAKKYIIDNSKKSIGDKVFLKKGTLLHGTYKNIEGLKEILTDGLISSWFIDGRMSKYPSSVGVWNLKEDIYLGDYINFYSGGTVKYYNQLDDKHETEVIPYNLVGNVVNRNLDKGYQCWYMEQTKESRFMPSLVQNMVQIGIIFDGNNDLIKNICSNDILNKDLINNEDVKDFVNPNYYERFIKERENKDDFFTDRESAILFGVPSNFIEGILVGRTYEKDKTILEEIKTLLPNCYICNLDGKVIM